MSQNFSSCGWVSPWHLAVSPLLWRWWQQLQGSCYSCLSSLNSALVPPWGGRSSPSVPILCSFVKPLLALVCIRQASAEKLQGPFHRGILKTWELGTVGLGLLGTYFCHVSFGNNLEPLSSFCFVLCQATVIPDSDWYFPSYLSLCLLSAFCDAADHCSGTEVWVWELYDLCLQRLPLTLHLWRPCSLVTQPAVEHEGSPNPIIPALPRSFTALCVPCRTLNISSCHVGCHEE